MCGVIGYVGKDAEPSFFYNGLKRLEYRGYDSAGIAIHGRSGIEVIRASGKLSALEKKLSLLSPTTRAGIGHTRWATHGEPTEKNAHPHRSGPFALLHNGIIENYQQLKQKLQRDGFKFESETDTEVAVVLLNFEYEKRAAEKDLVRRTKESILEVMRKIKGAFAFAIISSDLPDYLFAVKQGSPLVLGRGEGENYLASGIPALVEKTREFARLEDGDFAILTKESIEIFNRMSGKVERPFTVTDTTVEMLDKDGFEHFMQKEIYQHSLALRWVTDGRIDDGNINMQELGLASIDFSNVERIQCLACGTSYYACMIVKYILEDHSGIAVDVDLASEFRYRPATLAKNTLAIAVSQSGETIDTLFAMKYAREQGAKCLAFVNSENSSIEDAADAVVMLRAGVEVGVASTKALTAQVAGFLMAGLGLAHLQERSNDQDRRRIISGLKEASHTLEAILPAIDEKMRTIAESLVNVPGFLFTGRGIHWPVVAEGALKLRELAYVFAEAYAGGELKHGSIALIDNSSWVVVVAPRDQHFEKMLSNIAEIKARGGNIIAVGNAGDSELESISDHFVGVPHSHPELSPFYTVPALHLFAYWIARHKGNDIDQPRNLAKSVTVE